MPTLSPSTAATPGFASLLAGTPLSPAPAGDGVGDAFAAMLAGLTLAVPQDGDVAAPPPATGLPKNALLPQVRQDPAVWLPEEESAAPETAAAPGLELPPAQSGPLVFGPDCEMPAVDVGLPQPAADAPVPQPGPVDPILSAPKFWPLRLSSALTPVAVAPKAAPIDAPIGEAEPELDSHKPGEVAKPDLPAVSVAPQQNPAPEAPLPAPIAMPPAIVPPAKAAERGEAPSAAAPVGAAPVRTIGGFTPVQSTPAPAQAQPKTGTASDQAAPLQQQHAPTPAHAPEVRTTEPLQPELARRVAEIVERAAPSTAEPAVHAVPATGATPVPQPQPAAAPPQAAAPFFQPAPVDLGRAEWVQAMVDRIAELPNMEVGREAQIKLLPDALGSVEVKIVERDERMQVTLNAETVQARQLLSDAAPRLQELAEARGLRFAEPQVGGGQPQDRRSGSDQQQPQTPQRPRSTQVGADAEPQPKGELIA
jgi:flagellar hook-length control protein FliK